MFDYDYYVFNFFFLFYNRFNTGVINLIASTQVLEEGTDIRKCNVVVQFDEVANYRSYVQARGRARDANSTYYYFLEGNPKALNPITEWHTMNRLFDKLNKLVRYFFFCCFLLIYINE